MTGKVNSRPKHSANLTATVVQSCGRFRVMMSRVSSPKAAYPIYISTALMVTMVTTTRQCMHALHAMPRFACCALILMNILCTSCCSYGATALQYSLTPAVSAYTLTANLQKHQQLTVLCCPRSLRSPQPQLLAR